MLIGDANHEDDRHRRSAQRDRQGDQGGQPGASEVGQEHHPFAIAPIGEGARHHPQEKVRERLQGADDPHRQPRTGQREHEQGQGGEADGVTERGDTLARQEDLEVAVLRERLGGRLIGHVRDGTGGARGLVAAP